MEKFTFGGPIDSILHDYFGEDVDKLRNNKKKENDDWRKVTDKRYLERL